MLNKNIIAERLKECRTEQKYTLEEIGAFCGVHKSTVQRWENGNTEKIGLPIIRLLSKKYNVSSAWLSGKDVPKKEQPTNYSKLSERERFMIDLLNKVPEAEQEMVVQMIEAALRAKGLYE